ncbi:MAG: histidine phosphatase family protein [Kofleriaceae bacterium]|nr:histidine phosphatase family protein [Kofleriaceae bacterium]
MLGSSSSGPTLTTFWLVRHGEAENNSNARFGGWDSAPLTARGQAQATAVGNALANRARAARIPPSIIITSDVARAAATAQAIATATALPLQTDPALRERTVGIFDGMSFVDAKAQHPEAYAALLARDESALPQGAETNAACFARVSAGLDRVAQVHSGATIILVSHGIALFHMLSHITRMGPPDAASRFFTLVDNASLSVVEHYASPELGSSWRLCQWNDNGHLRDLA